MASFAPDKPNLPAPGADTSSGSVDDPFVSNVSNMSNASSGPAHHRFSNFDHELFAAGPGSSPRQAKRALEAHLAETDRRLDEAGKLGTALVTQRKALTEQLQEVENMQAEGELGPELRQKLVEIEKEYNDLARESARAFLPKQRVPSNEANPGSPYVPEGRSGRVSICESFCRGHELIRCHSAPSALPSSRVRPPGLLPNLTCPTGRSGTSRRTASTTLNSLPRSALL